METIVKIGIERYNDLKNTVKRHEMTHVDNIDTYFDDLDRYPHIYVLACLMDRGIKAEKAWRIPFDLCSYFNAFEMSDLAKLTQAEITEYFLLNKPHRYNKDMAKVFYCGVQMIHTTYKNNAAEIWQGKPSSAAVIYRFLQFEGVGIKIATMATNILVREYHIELSDYYSIDISPDVHVKRIFYRLGLTDNQKDVNLVVYKARELYPTFPGIIDVACWEIGRTFCHPANPNCKECPLRNNCPKIGVLKQSKIQMLDIDLKTEKITVSIAAIVNYIKQKIDAAREHGEESIILVSGSIGDEFGKHVKNNYMPTICNAMLSIKKDNDEIVFHSPSYRSTKLEIKYFV